MLWNCEGYDDTVGIYYVPHDMISIFEKMLTHNISQAGSRAIWKTTTADTESSHLCPDTQWNIPVSQNEWLIFDHTHQLLQSSSTVGHTLPNIRSIERHIDTARVFVVLDTATNDHAGYDGMVILPWFSDNSWPWQGFRIRSSTNALTMRLGLSREKITLLESRLSTIHTQFRFTTHRKAAASQGNRVSTLSSPHLHYWVASANTTHQSREIERLAKGNGILRVCQPVGLDFYQIHRASPGTAELLHETAQHPIWVYPNRYMPHQGLFESRRHHWCEMYHGKW